VTGNNAFFIRQRPACPIELIDKKLLFHGSEYRKIDIMCQLNIYHNLRVRYRRLGKVCENLWQMGNSGGNAHLLNHIQWTAYSPTAFIKNMSINHSDKYISITYRFLMIKILRNLFFSNMLPMGFLVKEDISFYSPHIRLFQISMRTRSSSFMTETSLLYFYFLICNILVVM